MFDRSKKKDPEKALTDRYKKELNEVKKKAEAIELTVDATEDYEKSRETLHNLISKADDALDSLMNLAYETEHPRTFEVLAGLIKTTSDLTDRLMKLQKERDDLNRNKNTSSGNSNTTNNTMFIGSTAELQKFLKDPNNIKYAETEDQQ